MTRRNYSPHYDPDRARSDDQPTPHELARDAAEDRYRRDEHVTGPLVDAVRKVWAR